MTEVEHQLRLMKAAPQMLTALRAAYGCLAYFKHEWDGRSTVEGQRLLAAMRDAIAEATGGDAQAIQDTASLFGEMGEQS